MDRFWASTGDARLRSPGRIEAPPADGGRPRWPSVGELGDAEPLLALPSAPFPATIEVNAVVDHQASVAYRGNRYSVPPGLAGMTMCLRQRLGTTSLDVLSPAGACLVTHPLAAPGSGAMVRSVAHRDALSSAVLGAFTSTRPDLGRGGQVNRRGRCLRTDQLGPLGEGPRAWWAIGLAITGIQEAHEDASPRRCASALARCDRIR